MMFKTDPADDLGSRATINCWKNRLSSWVQYLRNHFLAETESISSTKRINVLSSYSWSLFIWIANLKELCHHHLLIIASIIKHHHLSHIIATAPVQHPLVVVKMIAMIILSQMISQQIQIPVNMVNIQLHSRIILHSIHHLTTVRRSDKVSSKPRRISQPTNVVLSSTEGLG